MHCPLCGSDRIRPSRLHTAGEKFLYRVGLRAPYRCSGCKRRYFGPKHESLRSFLGLRALHGGDIVRVVIGLLVLALVFQVWQQAHNRGAGKKFSPPRDPPTPPALRQ